MVFEPHDGASNRTEVRAEVGEHIREKVYKFVRDHQRRFDRVKQILFGYLALETQRLNRVEKHHIRIGRGTFFGSQSLHSFKNRCAILFGRSP